VTFLGEQSRRLMVAEEQLDGRSPEVRPPSARPRGNLMGDVAGDHAAAVSVVVDRLRGMALDVRRRADAIADAPEAPMLVELANGLEALAGRLGSGD
jgi:hypothetical protein